MKFGAHMSTAGGPAEALKRGEAAGCDVVQLFVKNNKQWFGRPFGKEELTAYANELAKQRFAAVFGHAGYLINLGGPDGENRDKSIKSLIQEIQLATDLGIPFLVLHPGAHLKAGEEAGIKQIGKGLDEVFRASAKSPVRIALENTAGQGTTIGGTLRHHAAIYAAVRKSDRLGLCLDTCHYYAAGYDVRTPKGWDAAIAEVEELLGLDQILAFHLNDSKGELGSHLDRHDHIGAGKIGKAGFKHIVRDARFTGTPASLETPKSDDLHEDIENLRVLRELAAG
ncbi:MAG TPA: deoxyribonuclease IV [Verrucomicrobiales bacterium]|nr:deoxyribonuclease IV [Verrucomicrobiales bacterium]